ncbi:MAG: EMC3/TMCO1 family protein [Promethearchaeota archaeon]
MAHEDIILQILFISIGIYIFSLILNKIMGLQPQKMKLFREKILNLQERFKQAQIIGDPQLLQSLQLEFSQIAKDMMKKQMIPMCFRCIIFIGILIVLNFIYADYATGLLPFPLLFLGDGWFALYFIFALSISLLVYGFKKLYFKITGKESKRTRIAKEMMDIQGLGGIGGLGGMLGGNYTPSSHQIISSPITSTTNNINSEKETSSDPDTKSDINKSISWKDKLER